MSLWALLFACQGVPSVVPEPPSPVVLAGPQLVHVPVEGPLATGVSVPLSVEASDPDGVDAVELYWRRAGELAYARLLLEPAGEGVWTGALPGGAFPGTEYWIRGLDSSQWRVAASLPVEGAALPFQVSVLPTATELPFFEAFEGVTQPAFGLYELGWSDAARGFRGQRWRVGGGEQGLGAVHDVGAVGIEERDDYLVSPTFDLRGVDSAEVRWRELGTRTHLASHSLFVSTGSPLVDDGDFRRVAVLEAPPEGVWWSAPAIDLSAFVGQPRVTLAWRAQGAEADSWRIDDVHVRTAGPDLRIREVTQPYLLPGDAGVLAVRVTNEGASTTGVELAGQVRSGLIGLPTVVELGAFERGASRVVSLPVVVAPEQPNHRLAFAELTVSDADHVFTRDQAVLIGSPSHGEVRFNLRTPGTVDVRLGVGSTGTSGLQRVVVQGPLPEGVHTFHVDLTDRADLLPAQPGRLRWWTTVNSSAPGNLLGFGLTHGDETVWTTDLGAFTPSRQGRFTLPEQADLRVGVGEVELPPLVPGSTVEVSVGVRNLGGPFSGPATLSLQSAHPALTVPANQQVLPPDWDEHVLTVPMTVGASHVDSTDLPLTLQVTDALETLSVGTTLPVPWPAIRTGGVSVDGDGRLDPGETARLSVFLRNDGALDPGAVTCTTTVTGGPPTTLTLGPAVLEGLPAGTFVLLQVGVALQGGVPGDELALDVRCTGALGTWVNPVRVPVGGPPWRTLPLDPAGDALPGASIDLREARWRRDAGRLAVQLQGVNAVDPATLQLEIWMRNPGSTWVNHVITVNGGLVELYGVRSQGWVLLATPDLTVDGATLTFEVEESAMGLVDPSLSIAMGSGFCGAAGFHCDQWPDAWGNPFVNPLDTSTWPVMGWGP